MPRKRKRQRKNRKRCRKVIYRTREDARIALAFAKDRGCKRFYRCPYHEEEVWHLTSQSKKCD